MRIELDDVCYNKAASIERCLVGFRNVVVHAYQSINLDVLRSIIQSGWKVFVDFGAALGLRIEVKRG